MRVSTKVRYAIRALIYIASLEQGNKMINIKEISEKEGISERYLENIFIKLKKQGILSSQKGKNGGFQLIKKLEDISVLDVIKAVDGDIYLVWCAEEKKSCDKSFNCRVRNLWIESSKEVAGIFEKKKLSQI